MPKIAQQNQLVYVAKEPLLHCHRATTIMQNSLSCLSNSRSIGVQERLFCMMRMPLAPQSHTKTALKNSKINFYFVTCFYHLYDICIFYTNQIIQYQLWQETRKHQRHYFSLRTSSSPYWRRTANTAPCNITKPRSTALCATETTRTLPSKR